MIRLFRTCLAGALILGVVLAAHAQHARTGKDSAVLKKDSTVRLAKTGTLLVSDSLIDKMDDVHQALDRINNFSGSRFDTRDIEQQLPEVQANMQIISDNLNLYSSVLNTRNLQMFGVLLDEMQDELSGWRDDLFNYNKELVTMNSRMQAFNNDSTMRQVMKDTLFRRLYTEELKELRTKWVTASRTIAGNLGHITELQATVSNAYFAASDLQGKLQDQQRKAGTKVFSQEYPPIWAAQPVTDSNKAVMRLARRSYRSQGKVLSYYFSRHQDNWWWLALIFVVLFAWIFRNFRRLKKAGAEQDESLPNFRYVRAIPLMSALVVAINAAPFLDLNPPSAYVEIMQFVLLLVLTVCLLRNWPRRQFVYWIVLFVLFLLFSFSNAAVSSGVGQRWWLLLLNAVSIVFGFFFWRKERDLPLRRFVRPATITFIVLNILGILANVFGRLSMAKVLGSAAILGLTQVIGLSVLVEVISEAFMLQMIATRIAGGAHITANMERIQRTLIRGLSLIAMCCWLIIIATNLNIWPFLYNMGDRLLNRPHRIGNTSFTLGRVLLFAAVLYVSNILQKYVGYFFGEAGETVTGEDKKKRGRMLILRLIVLCIGFLLAIAASGLPMDKITVVLGALGVGIGLGLQEIVNNLVSGVILIFERPFQLGDYVEMDGQKGRVQDIGIRASRIITSEGAEIIVPNGHLLSGNLVNWTLSNNHVRVEMPVKVQPGANWQEARELILEELNQHQGVLQRKVNVLLSNISDESAELVLQFWVSDVHQEDVVKSDLLAVIYQRLKEKNWTMG